MTVTAADIGKLVRVGDVPTGGVVRCNGPLDGQWTIDQQRVAGVWLRGRPGESASLASGEFVRLLSLPADRDVKPENAPPIDPHRVYGGAPWVGPLNTTPLGLAVCAPACDPVAPGEIAPRLTAPTTHPCPERATCGAQIHDGRVALDAMRAERDAALRDLAAVQAANAANAADRDAARSNYLGAMADIAEMCRVMGEADATRPVAAAQRWARERKTIAGHARLHTAAVAWYDAVCPDHAQANGSCRVCMAGSAADAALGDVLADLAHCEDACARQIRGAAISDDEAWALGSRLVDMAVLVDAWSIASDIARCARVGCLAPAVSYDDDGEPGCKACLRDALATGLEGVALLDLEARP